MTQADTEQLEQIDEMWMRNLFECSQNVPKDLLYLELGLVPISFILKGRKQMFLHHILQQNEHSLLYRFVMAQMNSPSQNDWVSRFLDEMVELDIDIEIEEIKALVNEIVSRKAFIHLIERKSSRNSDRAKGKYLEYNELNISDYLNPTGNELSIDERKWVFKCRIEDFFLINTNKKWKNGESKCTKCPNTVMDQN